jgi:hypothetical protein
MDVFMAGFLGVIVGGLIYYAIKDKITARRKK